MRQHDVRSTAGGSPLIRSERALPVLWRFFTGAPLDGQPRTDATWTHRGRIPTTTKPPRWWDYLTRWERLGIRWACIGGVGGLGYSYLHAPEPTVDGLHYGGTGLGALLAFIASYKATDGLLTWRHRRDWVWPLHVALRPALGLPPGTKPSSYITLPRDFHKISGDAIRIELPADWVGDRAPEEAQASVASILRTKLGLQDVSFCWRFTGRDHHLIVRQAPRPPDLVLFSDPQIQRIVASAPEDAPVIGLSHSNRVVSVSLDSESPHILVSASTGGGKSVILRTLAAQFLRNGARVVVLDRKRHSHKWLRGLPGVTYCRDIEDIHDALIQLGLEGDRRNRLVDNWDGPEDEAPVGFRILILFEEANATIPKLKRYWQKIRTKDDPKESPAIEALGEILFMGRAVKMNVLLVAQSATANALGGPEMRENFATRILARYTKNAWNMLVPEVQPVPKPTRHIGRCQVVIGGKASETQVLFFTPEEARVWALSGTKTHVIHDPTTLPAQQAPAMSRHGVTSTPLPGDDTPERHVTAGADPQPALPTYTVIDGGQAPAIPDKLTKQESADSRAQSQDEPELYTMADAIRYGIVQCSYDALRQAKVRDPEFPPPDGKKKGRYDAWYAETLQRWERNRPRAAGEE